MHDDKGAKLLGSLAVSLMLTAAWMSLVLSLIESRSPVP